MCCCMILYARARLRFYMDTSYTCIRHPQRIPLIPVGLVMLSYGCVGREEEEDAEGDGHDVSRELTAGVDGRAACVRGKDRGKARRRQ